jgi:hypothetical protein
MTANKIIGFMLVRQEFKMDCIATEDGEDFSWDAIWDSEVTTTDFGW